MASTPSTILRFELQGSQDNTGAWDVNANRVFTTTEEAIAGFYDHSSTGGDTTLTPVNYATDNARKPYIRISNGQTITSMVRVVSATPRKFLVHNASAAGSFDVKFGGSLANALVIPRGCICEILVRSDLSTIYTSPFIDVATGQVNAASLTTLYGYIPIQTQNVSIGVLSSTLATPPGSPTSGDRYIVATGGTGAWSTKDGYIAQYNGSGWDFTAPSAGMIAWDRANHWLTGYDAGGWQRGAVTDPIPTGGVTVMPFFQAAAPTGWTKQTTHNNKGIRVVSGTGGGNGGTRDFTTVFGLTAVDGATLSQATLPSVNFNVTGTFSGSQNGGGPANQFGTQAVVNATGGSTVVPTSGQANNITVAGSITGAAASGGSGSQHAHNIDLRLAYIDLILCSRD